MKRFLLTLGVWEVIPVEAFESRDMQNRQRLPWTGRPHELRMQRISEAGGWQFVGHSWTGGEHRNVWIAEDFRFRWSPADADADAPCRRTAHDLRRTKDAGLEVHACCHTFRVTGITAYLENGGTIEKAQ